MAVMGPLGLLVLVAMTWDLIEVCGWLVWGIWVVRTVVTMVLWSWSEPAWDGASTGNSLAGPFLGGISLVFCRAREHGGRQCWYLFAEG
jgi:hypothetical protein